MTKESLVGHKKGFFLCDKFNVSFVALTQCKKTNINEMEINAKIENHCSKKIRLGYLFNGFF